MYNKSKASYWILHIAVGLTVCFAAILLFGTLRPKMVYAVSNIDDQHFEQYEMEAIHAVEKNDNVIYNAIYSVETSYALMEDDIFVFVPYVCCDIGNVPTAGGAPWKYTAGVVAMLWRGGRQVHLREIELEDAALMVTADSNTVLKDMMSSYSNDVHGKFVVSEENFAVSYDAENHAVTRDSMIAPNSESSCLVCWEGICTVPRSFLRPSISVGFSVDTEASYLNNIT